MPTPTAWYVIVTLSPVPATPTPTPAVTPTATDTPTITPIPPTDTPSPPRCDETHGTMVTFQFYSEIQEREVPFRVYAPPCYRQTERRYPYVILLHGLSRLGYTDAQWDNLGVDTALDRGITIYQDLPPMLLVMPDGGEIADLNRFDEESYEYVILNELIPQVERVLCTWNAREARAIGGISRGGFWAFEIAFRHPDMFSAVGGHSPHFDTQDNVPPENDPLELALTMPIEQLRGLRIYFDHAADDPVRPSCERLSRSLTQRGVEHEYRINPTGGHTDAYWEMHMREYLEFYGREWPRDPYQLPSCLEPSP